MEEDSGGMDVDSDCPGASRSLTNTQATNDASMGEDGLPPTRQQKKGRKQKSVVVKAGTNEISIPSVTPSLPVITPDSQSSTRSVDSMSHDGQDSVDERGMMDDEKLRLKREKHREYSKRNKEKEKALGDPEKEEEKKRKAREYQQRSRAKKKAERQSNSSSIARTSSVSPSSSMRSISQSSSQSIDMENESRLKQAEKTRKKREISRATSMRHRAKKANENPPATPISRDQSASQACSSPSIAQTPSASLAQDLDSLLINSQGSQDGKAALPGPIKKRSQSDAGPGAATPKKRPRMFRRPDETLAEYEARKKKRNPQPSTHNEYLRRDCSDGEEMMDVSLPGEEASRAESVDGDMADGEDNESGDEELEEARAVRAARDKVEERKEWKTLNKMKSHIIPPDMRDYSNPENAVPKQCRLGPILTCTRCGAITYNTDNCCAGGQVLIPPPVDQHPYIRDLLSGDQPKNKHMQKNSVKYNASLAMGAISYERDMMKGEPFMKVNGGMHCMLAGTSLPNGKTVPLCHQLYKYDVNEATRFRLANPVTGGSLMPRIARNLHAVLEEENYLVRQYKCAVEIFAEQAKKSNEPIRNVFLLLRTPEQVNFSGQSHRGCYSQPKQMMQSAIYTMEPDGGPGKMTITIKHRQFGGRLENLGFYNPLVDPLEYPLIHNYGNPGFKRVYKRGVDYRYRLPGHTSPPPREDEDVYDKIEREMPILLQQMDLDNRYDMNPFPFHFLDDEMDKDPVDIDYHSARLKWKDERREKGEDVSSSEDETDGADKIIPDPKKDQEEEPVVMEEYASDDEFKPHFFLKDSSDEEGDVSPENAERIVKVACDPVSVLARKEEWRRKEKEMEDRALEKERRIALKNQKLRKFKADLLGMRYDLRLLERLFKDSTEIKNLNLDLDLLQRSRENHMNRILDEANVFIAPLILDRFELKSYEDYLRLEKYVNYEMEGVLHDKNYRREEPKIARFLATYLSPSKQDDNEDKEVENIDPVQREVGEAYKTKRIKAVTNAGGKREWVSRREYVQHQMQMRNPSFHPVLSTLGLGQLYIIDQALRIVRQRHDNSRGNMIKLRGSHESTLTFQMHAKSAERKGFNLGYAFQLTPDDHGSPAWYKQQFENAMAIMDSCGKPDLFITMTGDPKWEEIEENKLPHSTWQSNPFLVNDVFHLKQQELLNDVVQKECFGPVVAWCYSIEFQKRGMPHMHLLVTLKEGYKLDTPDKIDKHIQVILPPEPAADDPHRELKQRFRDNVCENMVHTPCKDNPDAYCNVRTGRAATRLHDRCTKNFPVPFNTHTSTIDGGKVQYYRPDDGVFCEKKVNGKTVKADNRYVVAYNPFLLNKYKCHINVEAVTEVNVIKYVYKYIYKGFDKALAQFIETFEMDDGAHGLPGQVAIHANNEDNTGVMAPRGIVPKPRQMVQMRNRLNEEMRKQQVVAKPGERLTAYDEAILVEEFRQMTASEAAYIIQAYPLSSLSHVVITLRVHEEGQMPVHWKEGELQKMLQKVAEGKVKSKFLAWLDLNKKDNFARTLTYKEIPLYYTFEKTAEKCEWRKYKNNRVLNIVRVQPVNPRFLEKFSIRLLAMNQRGPRSFQELRTVNGRPYDTAHDAAIAMGLMNSQLEFRVCLAEAVKYEYPHRLRALFAAMLIYGGLEDPGSLWKEFEPEFYDRKWGKDVARAREAALSHVEYLLSEHGTDLKTLHLPRRNPSISLTEAEINYAIDGHESRPTPTDDQTEAEKMEKTLNVEQREAFKTILRAVENNGTGPEGSCFFLQGSGGCGKTFLYRALYHRLMSQLIPVSMSATTGIAATLLINGTTAHRRFMLPLNCGPGARSMMQLKTQPADLLKETTVFIIDEATMASRFMFEAIDHLLRDIMGKQDTPFGGKIILLGGDWKQLLPVVKGASGHEAAQFALKRDPLWKSFKVLTLTKNMRAEKDPVYSTLLENVGNGLVNGKQDLNVRLDHSCVAQSMEEVIQFIYPDINASPKEIAKSCVLSTINDDVAEINDKILDMLPGKIRVYTSIDLPREGAGMQCSPEYYWKELPSGMPPHELRLKEGAIVILLKNICVSKGLCNGSRLRVVAMRDMFIECELLTTAFAGRIVWISKCNNDPATKSAKDNTNFTRFQIPVRLAYAMTINKSQGQTFDQVGVILKNNVFSHGQLYVALSRTRETSKLRIFSGTREFHNGKPVIMIRNMVDRSILEPLPVGALIDPNYIDPGLVPTYVEPVVFKRTPGKQFVHDNSKPQSAKYKEMIKQNSSI